VPLAALRAVLGQEIDNRGVASRIRQWYWCGVVGELYVGAIETRFVRDLEGVLDWLMGGPLPATVVAASFQAERLLTLRTRNSAAYKGIYALLMQDKCLDWQKKRSIDMATFLDYQIDIHHIFPKAWCASKVDEARRESIVNKTAISYSTNRSISGRAPSSYLPIVQRNGQISTSEELDEIVATHRLDPVLLRADDFDRFFADRAERLLQLISSAMGKEAVRGDSAPTTPTPTNSTSLSCSKTTATSPPPARPGEYHTPVWS
jgi:hypothetical protein